MTEDSLRRRTLHRRRAAGDRRRARDRRRGGRTRQRRHLDRRRRGDLGADGRRDQRRSSASPVLTACRALFGKLFGTTGRLAGDNAIRNPRRTGVTAAALMIGLTLVSAVGVLAASMSATDGQARRRAVRATSSCSRRSSALPGRARHADGQGRRRRRRSRASRACRSAWTTRASPTRPSPRRDAAFSDVYDLTMVDGHRGPRRQRQAIVNEVVAKDMDLTSDSSLDLQFPGGQDGPGQGVGHLRGQRGRRAGSTSASRPRRGGHQAGRQHASASTSPTGPTADAVKVDLDDVVKDLPIVSVQDKQDFKS